MNVTFENIDRRLIIHVDGHVDANEAIRMQSEIETAINTSADSVDAITLDAQEMSFISSMGLRVIIALKKRFDDFVITEVSPEVYNVFDITGLVRIMTIEKSLPHISLAETQLVNGTQSVYRISDDTVVKVYDKTKTKADVDREVAIAKELFVMGIPTALAFDVVRVDGCLGVVYESTSVEQVSPDVMARMLHLLHDQKVDPDGELFPSILNRLKDRVSALEPIVGEDAVHDMLYMLGAVPEGTSLLHGNMKPVNIMLQNGEHIFTGISNVGYGNHIFDLINVYSSLTAEQKGEWFDTFLCCYYEDLSATEREGKRDVIDCLSVISEILALAHQGTPESAERIREIYDTVIKERWDEILSRLKFKMDFQEGLLRLERENFFLDGQVNIDWVARRLGTNRHYVSDYFNKVLHTTFVNYINNLRLDYVMKLIKTGRYTPTQAGYAAGFNSDHTFRRLFKQRYGRNPSQEG